jgi:hypothetical protein
MFAVVGLPLATGNEKTGLTGRSLSMPEVYVFVSASKVLKIFGRGMGGWYFILRKRDIPGSGFRVSALRLRSV